MGKASCPFGQTKGERWWLMEVVVVVLEHWQMDIEFLDHKSQGGVSSASVVLQLFWMN